MKLKLHPPCPRRIGTHAYVGGHLAYFVSVAFEGHGFYALCGAFMFCMALLNCFFHFVPDGE